jgi:hypothetical protein
MWAWGRGYSSKLLKQGGNTMASKKAVKVNVGVVIKNGKKYVVKNVHTCPCRYAVSSACPKCQWLAFGNCH